MAKSLIKYSDSFSVLQETLTMFIQEVNRHHLQNMATDEWSVKDVLCHIVFWHRYYAQNYLALARGKEPAIFTSKGGSIRNQEGVDSLKHNSKNELIKLLQDAQQSLYESIVIKGVAEMNYTDHKKYNTEDFLAEIIRHLRSHTKQIKKTRIVSN